MPRSTESSCLLSPLDSQTGESAKDPSSWVLLEIIGARHLPTGYKEPYCAVLYGPRALHRTKPFSPKQGSRISRALSLFGSSPSQSSDPFRNPIWTVQENSLMTLSVSSADIANNKALKITVWARPRGRRLSPSQATQPIGSIRIKAPKIINDCSSERREIQLTNELDVPIYGSHGEPTQLAYRCRIASTADVRFVQNWLTIPRPRHWRETDIVPDPDLSRAKLTTEKAEQDIHATSAGINPIPPPLGCVRVKPYPDPKQAPESNHFINVDDLKTNTKLPSQKWIQAGSRSSSIGKLYVEILSAHGLPNVDIGGTVGNETDAFCSIVYGDAMAQTDVIFDELNPHWPSWSQRAFVFHMQHPSHVLYLVIFGFKRSPLHHRPIGRVEVNPINFYNATAYNLEYKLYGTSHAMNRKSYGSIRIRVRVEMHDERKALIVALIPPKAICINTAKKKSMAVARYTACGEYDNQARFSLQVLQGYIDEILEGYLRRILYSLQDGSKSLILWRNQVVVCGIDLPLFSFLAFLIGILIVEKPRLIPAMMCFVSALFLFVQMNQRVASPSPWHRCHSFSHYFHVLVYGRSTKKNRDVLAFEGAQQFEEQEETLRQRIAHDKKFLEKKEAIEKEIEEIENLQLDDKSQPLPMELLIVLGKVQSIVGDVCRLCRLVDAVITWEESDVAFWITLSLLLIGVAFFFVPWGWLLLWTGRISVVLLLGPQNRVIDLLYYKDIPTDDQRIYQIFAQRMFEARCRQEDAGKLKAFRRLLFGKFATWVPSLYWSPHQDYPLATSNACASGSDTPSDVCQLPIIPGQTIYGKMIPRPFEQWKKNDDVSQAGLRAAMKVFGAKNQAQSNQANNSYTFGEDGGLDHQSAAVEEGVEIADWLDEEMGFVQGVPSYRSVETNEATSVYRPSFPEVDQESRQSSDESDEDSALLLIAPTEVMRIPTQERRDQQSMIDLGVEIPFELMPESKEGGRTASTTRNRYSNGMERNQVSRAGTEAPEDFYFPSATTVLDCSNDDDSEDDENNGFEVIAES